MNDPQVNQAIEQTEAELKKRELDLQGKHQEVLSESVIRFLLNRR